MITAIAIILGACLFLPVLLLNVNADWWPALIGAFIFGLLCQHLLRAWRERGSSVNNRRRIG